MDITTYTSYDEIRAALGVSDDELEDTTLALGVYGSVLNIAMSEINTDFATYLSTQLTNTTRSNNEQLFVDHSKLFCTYVVAQQLCTALPMFSVKDVSDSKTSAGRFSQDPYKETKADVSSSLEKYKNKAIEYFNLLNPSQATSSISTGFTIIAKSTPTFNPVIGS